MSIDPPGRFSDGDEKINSKSEESEENIVSYDFGKKKKKKKTLKSATVALNEFNTLGLTNETEGWLAVAELFGAEALYVSTSIGCEDNKEAFH